MYEGMRFVPWVSTPRRSARTRHEAIVEACSGGTPLAVRMVWVKVWAVVEEICFFGGWSMVVVSVVEYTVVRRRIEVGKRIVDVLYQVTHEIRNKYCR